MELENITKSEKRLEKGQKIKIPKSLKRYIRRLKAELRKELMPEDEIKKKVNEIILKYLNEREDN
jgi:iron-sulfur cluster repair protein YtfE (RIC family)